ncbi:MAG: hypothetical protein Q4A82_07385 [Corynebacterium sp.]|nr:hypothetical protein [Corynebacterium sp.]
MSTRRTQIDPEHLTALNTGRAEANNLAEALAVDQAMLFDHVFPNASADVRAAVAAAQKHGILKKMHQTGVALNQHFDGTQLAELTAHPSDTVRGWACFARAATPGIEPATLLQQLHPLADDPHFAVREWAWLATRPVLVSDLTGSIQLLIPWTAHDSQYIRRFASEALRPRGVWSTHIAELKTNPELGIPLLEPLRADPARYVQDSVANWINDVARTKPDWVRKVCAEWLRDSPTAATQRIVKRAQRSLS